MGHCWRSKDELLSDILLWFPSYGHVSVCQSMRTYLQQFCVDTERSLKDLLEVMDDEYRWRERERERESTVTWWWYPRNVLFFLATITFKYFATVASNKSQFRTLSMTLNCLWWWGSSSGALKRVESLLCYYYPKVHHDLEE